jgi:hypothetical protein
MTTGLVFVHNKIYGAVVSALIEAKRTFRWATLQRAKWLWGRSSTTVSSGASRDRR